MRDSPNYFKKKTKHPLVYPHLAQDGAAEGRKEEIVSANESRQGTKCDAESKYL